MRSRITDVNELLSIFILNLFERNTMNKFFYTVFFFGIPRTFLISDQKGTSFDMIDNSCFPPSKITKNERGKLSRVIHISQDFFIV